MTATPVSSAQIAAPPKRCAIRPTQISISTPMPTANNSQPTGARTSTMDSVKICSFMGTETTTLRDAVPFAEALRVWIRVAALSFGGPAGQIAVMHRILVEEKRWISEARFMHALNYCMVLPGPEAQQLATYIGWLLHGTRGGVVAGTLFVLPGFVSILALSILYAGFLDLTLVQAVFFGIKAAVLAIIVLALLRLAGRALHSRAMLAFAALAFIALFFLQLPFPLVIIAAGVAAMIGARYLPQAFVPAQGVVDAAQDAAQEPVAAQRPSGRSMVRRSLRVAAVWLSLWLVPLLLIGWSLGLDDVFTRIGLLLSKLAVVSFGGAYAVLAYLAQEAVTNHGWLEPGEMLDGLGMAEATPGPLIQVVQYVAYLGAYRDPGLLSPLMAGVYASVLATWVTFVPCFLWIFLGAPYVEMLRNNRLVSAALSGITAAVVGVMLNLALWFAIHVLFRDVHESHAYGIRLLLPSLASVEIVSLVLAVAAFSAIRFLRLGLLPVIGISAALGAAVWLLVYG
jgi:chromate transporter